MADSGPDAVPEDQGAFVRLVGRLGATPVLKEIKRGREHFCEVEIETNGCSLPVRFTGGQAEEITRWQKGCRVILGGCIERHEWQTAGRAMRERMVVTCSRIESVEPAPPETRARSIA